MYAALNDLHCVDTFVADDEIFNKSFLLPSWVRQYNLMLDSNGGNYTHNYIPIEILVILEITKLSSSGQYTPYLSKQAWSPPTLNHASWRVQWATLSFAE